MKRQRQGLAAAEVSIIILAHDRWDQTRRCLRSLRDSTEPGRYEVLACDNASSDRTLPGLRGLARGWPELRVFHNPRNLSFAAANNRLMRSARGRYLLWLNNDTEPAPGWLEGLLAAAESGADVAAAGPMTENLAPPRQLCRPFRTALPSRFEDALFLGGFCFLVKRAAAQGAGLLDERFVWGWEDMDYCLRLRQAGQRLVLARDVFVRHAGSGTLRTMPALKRKRLDMRNRRLILGKWAHAEPWGRELEKLMAQLPAPWHPHRPKVSVLVICWGKSGAGRAALRSLRRFARDPGCEVLAVAAGGESRTYAHLESFREDWPELKVLRPGGSASYGAAVNRGAAQAKGDYLVICDGGTAVRAGWLKSLLRAALSRPDVGVVRSGRVTGGWGEACLLIPRPVFDRVGGFDERFAGRLGAADYSARALQEGFCLVEADENGIQGGCGVPPSDQDCGLAAQKWLVQESLWKGARLPDVLRPAASVIVLCRNNWRDAKRCLESLRSASGEARYEVLAASLGRDRKTSAGLTDLARTWTQLRVLGPWAGESPAQALNLAARSARGGHLVLLREDVVTAPGWLERLIAMARAHPEAGVVAPACPDSDLAWQKPGRSARARRARYLRDHCLLIPRQVLARVGDFDERFRGSLWAEDFCFRVWQKGLEVLVAQWAVVRTRGRGNDPARRPPHDLKLLFHKWTGQAALDLPPRV